MAKLWGTMILIGMIGCCAWVSDLIMLWCHIGPHMVQVREFSDGKLVDCHNGFWHSTFFLGIIITCSSGPNLTPLPCLLVSHYLCILTSCTCCCVLTTPSLLQMCCLHFQHQSAHLECQYAHLQCPFKCKESAHLVRAQSHHVNAHTVHKSWVYRHTESLSGRLPRCCAISRGNPWETCKRGE